MDYILTTKNELYHYGIKGQQHGKRRFQNEDGSLTEAGKIRYGRGKKNQNDDASSESEPGVIVGGHNVKGPPKSKEEKASEERQRKLEMEAKRKAEEAMAAIDELNKENVHREELKRKRLGEAKRFGTDKPINEKLYSLKEFGSYVEAGREYFSRFKDKTLKHSGEKGQKWGVVRKHVGKYYIPKGLRNIKKFKNMNADELEDALEKHRAEKEKKKESRQKLNASNKLKDKKMSELSDEELESLMRRTNQEKVTSKNLNDIKKNEEGPATSTQDLIESAKSFKKTADAINKDYKKNPPLKKPKKQDLSEMSDDDIKLAIARKVLEQDYVDIMNSTNVSKGKVKAASILAGIGTAAVVGTQVADFIITAKNITK